MQNRSAAYAEPRGCSRRPATARTNDSQRVHDRDVSKGLVLTSDASATEAIATARMDRRISGGENVTMADEPAPERTRALLNDGWAIARPGRSESPRRSYEAIDSADDARAAFGRALDIDPGNAIATRHLRHLRDANHQPDSSQREQTGLGGQLTIAFVVAKHVPADQRTGRSLVAE
ncbi:MAG: hypothetical protein ACR2NR_02340 [Solirubrobacteraceae bacterium]